MFALGNLLAAVVVSLIGLTIWYSITPLAGAARFASFDQAC